MQIARKFYLQQLIDGKQNGLVKSITFFRRKSLKMSLCVA